MIHERFIAVTEQLMFSNYGVKKFKNEWIVESKQKDQSDFIDVEFCAKNLWKKCMQDCC
jgi:hypothetical protein